MLPFSMTKKIPFKNLVLWFVAYIFAMSKIKNIKCYTIYLEYRLLFFSYFLLS